MSDVFDLADAVAVRVNAGSYTLADSFTASGVALIDYDMDEIGDSVIVECVPRTKTVETLSRSKDRTEITIGVGVMKAITNTQGRINTSQVDGLVEFCEEIADQLRSFGFTVNGRYATWLNNEIDPIYDPDTLYSHQVFRSVVNATYLLTTP